MFGSSRVGGFQQRGPTKAGMPFGHFMEFVTLVEGNFALDLHDVLVNDDHVVALLNVTIAKGGKELSFPEVHVWHVKDGLMTEMWAIPQDPYPIDEFLA